MRLDLFDLGDEIEHLGRVLEPSFGDVVGELLDVDLHAVVDTFARLKRLQFKRTYPGLEEEVQPMQRGEVDGFGDVEAPVETCVVGSAEHEDELSLVVDGPIGIAFI